MQYLQSRPSAAGAGYDPTASSASNLGPESIVDTLPDPKVEGRHRQAVAADAGVQPQPRRRQARKRRWFPAVLHPERGRCGARGLLRPGPATQGTVTRAVSVNEACPAKPFIATYQGVKVECATFGADYSKGKIVPIRGDAPAHPGRARLMPSPPPDRGSTREISPAYADLQAPRIAKARGITDGSGARRHRQVQGRDAISASSASPGSTCCR